MCTNYREIESIMMDKFYKILTVMGIQVKM